MKKKEIFLSITISSILFFSCSNKTAEQRTADTVAVAVQNPPQDTVKKVVEKIILTAPFSEFNAVLLGGEIFLMADTTASSSNDVRVKKMSEVKIIEVGDNRVKLKGTQGVCMSYGYPYYLVETLSGQRGWVYGSDVFMKSKYHTSYNDQDNSGAFKFSGDPIIIQGQTFFLCMACDMGIGPSDSTGLTGCDNIFYPYLMDSVGNQFFIKGNPSYFEKGDWFIKNDPELDNLLYYAYSSEGGSASIESITVDGANLYFNNTHNYQDGGGSSVLTLRKTGPFLRQLTIRWNGMSGIDNCLNYSYTD